MLVHDLMINLEIKIARMFSIKQYRLNDFEVLALIDDEHNTIAEILPACGGILHAFGTGYNGGFFNVIAQHQNLQDFQLNNERSGFKSNKLSPFVCRMKNGAYQFAGKHYQTSKFFLGKHALHGLIYDANFGVVKQVASAESAAVTLLHEYKGTSEGYPFLYDCEITYSLSGQNTLTIQTIITNKDEGLIPIADGWHPYFSFGGSINGLQLEFQSNHHMLFDDELIPTGKKVPYDRFNALKQIGDTQFDDCFELDFSHCQPMLVLRDTEKKMQIEVRPDKSYPFLQLYTPGDRSCIAIENLSALPDAFNNGVGLKTLSSGESATFTTSFAIKHI